MNNEQAKEYAKSQLENYLRNKMINTRRNFKCLNPLHQDNTPSMGYKNNKCHCFSCGANYDIFDVVALDYGLDMQNNAADVFKKTYDVLGIEIDTIKTSRNNKTTTQKAQIGTKNNKDILTIGQEQKTEYDENNALDYTDYFNSINIYAYDNEYISNRGISNELIKRFNIGYDKNYKNMWQAIIIPTSKSSYVARNTDTSAAAKNRYRKCGASKMLNIDILQDEDNNKPIFIVEGEFDALSIIEAGGEAVALGSVANKDKLIEYVKTKDIKTPILFLALDNDDAGKDTSNYIKQQLANLKHIKIIDDAIMYGEYKDINDIIVNDKRLLQEYMYNASLILKEEQEQELVEYKKTNASNYVDLFLDGIKQNANTLCTPTGFKHLDKILEGGLYEGLYIIGAISSLGKTSYVLQIADYLAQQNKDVLIFSLEMAKEEIIAKSISRLTMLEAMQIDKENTKDVINGALAKTTRGITAGNRYKYYSQEEKEHINKCINIYKDYAKCIYINEGVGDIGVKQIKEVVEKHIKLTGNKPIVIIDYLQILQPYSDKITDKQAMDKAVLELKRLSRDNKIPIIGISSFNRENYNTKASMSAFKESGALEYSSDVLIGLQLKGVGESKDFDVDKAKSNHPREIEMKILKNRNGRTGDTIYYEFYSAFNYFKEQNAKLLSEEKDVLLTAPNKNKWHGIVENDPFEDKKK